MTNPHITAEDLSLVSVEMDKNIDREIRQKINLRYSHAWLAPELNIVETDFIFRLYLMENVLEIDNADVERDTI